MRIAALSFLAGLAELVVGLTVLRKEDPAAAVDEFAEKEEAKEYQMKWKEKGWQNSGKSCSTKKLPFTTDSVVFTVCGKNAKDGDKCVCNIAKAHSCHAGCRKIPTVCPAECKAQKCYQGAPINGGQELSKGGNNGVCYNYCSQKMAGVRYCGIGGAYQGGLFLDCTGCSPQSLKDMSPHQKKEKWIGCMADCFPTPSCQEMCGEGTPECYSNCVARYKITVEPYWDIFKGTLQAVPLTLHGQAIDDKAELVEEIAEEVAEEKAEKIPEKVPEKVVHEEEEEEYMDEHGDEEYDDEEYDDEEMDECHEDCEGDEECIEEECGEEGEWEDPWAGDNEWDFMLRSSGRPRLLNAKDHKAPVAKMVAASSQAPVGKASAPTAPSQPRIHNLHVRKHRLHPRRHRRHRHAKKETTKDDPVQARSRHKREDPWKFYSKKPRLVEGK